MRKHRLTKQRQKIILFIAPAVVVMEMVYIGRARSPARFMTCIFRGDSLSPSEIGAFAFEDELFPQLKFVRHGACRPRALPGHARALAPAPCL